MLFTSVYIDKCYKFREMIMKRLMIIAIVFVLALLPMQVLGHDTSEVPCGYGFLWGDDSDSLVKDVLKEIKSGWIPLGSPLWTGGGLGQAIVKYCSANNHNIQPNKREERDYQPQERTHQQEERSSKPKGRNFWRSLWGD